STRSDHHPGAPSFPTRRSSDLWSISANVLTYGPATLGAGASTSVHVITTTDKTECPNLHNAATFSTSNDGSGGAQADVAVNCGDDRKSTSLDSASVAAADAAVC